MLTLRFLADVFATKALVPADHAAVAANKRKDIA
jgi:hypothetical protein